ncbi:MAG: dTDP-4-dehydrorhamnose reductase [Pseudomarimonas sp.]
MPRILVTGVAGQVGFELQRALAPLGSLTITTRHGKLPGGADCEALDLTQPDSIAVLLDRIKPQILVNPAAYTAVDRAEAEPELAQRINVDAVAVMARWCQANDALFVHYSTDYVFNGAATSPWQETDPMAPLGVYGRTKRDGEDAVRASGARHLILRTAWVYAARGNNFLRTMLRLAVERDELRVVDDQFGAPTPARWIAAATALLLARVDPSRSSSEMLGTFHLTAAGQTSWHGFADAIMQATLAAGLLLSVPPLRAIASAEFPTAAARPRYSVLDGALLRDAHQLQLPDWRSGVDEVIAEIVTSIRA